MMRKTIREFVLEYMFMTAWEIGILFLVQHQAPRLLGTYITTYLQQFQKHTATIKPNKIEVETIAEMYYSGRWL